MTRLPVLRQQLTSLRRMRQTARLATAYCALAVVVLWLLSGVFSLDVIFELSILQRFLVLSIAAAAGVWAYSYFTAPMLKVHESDLEMALLVERQQQIDSDLVAALQFESPAASQWGSQQLEHAVIDYVSQLGPGLNIFEGFSRSQMIRRSLVLLGTLVVLGALAVPFGDYYGVFLNRLLMGSRHYPTDTVIQQVIVNHDPVLLRDRGDRSLPQTTNCAQGRSLTFLVQCSGETPELGLAKLISPNRRQRRDMELRKLSRSQRRARLVEAQTRLQAALERGEGDAAGPWGRELASLVRFDAPTALTWLDKARDDQSILKQAAGEVQKVIASWPPKQIDQTEIYRGTLPRLADELQYTLYLGDAWTDPARITMIPLPVVATQLTTTPPTYAVKGKQDKVDPSARQISVLEGSLVALSIRCTNKKKLTQAWLTAQTGNKSHRFPLVQQDDEGFHWSLKTTGTPFADVKNEIRYQIQVLDADGLNLETPIRGFVRLKADRIPTVVAAADYRAVLPRGAPHLKVRMADDYGIGKLEVVVEITRNPEITSSNLPPFQQETVTVKSLRPFNFKGEIIQAADPIEFPLKYQQLPLQGGFALNLSPFQLAKGDRVKVTFVATDVRGELEGQTGESEPLVLEVTDEAGILAAMSEFDGRSEKKLTEIEKRQKQLLGIGDSP